MKKLLLVVTLALLAVPLAVASLGPPRHYKGLMDGRVCGSPVVLVSKMRLPRDNAAVMVDGYVNGYRLKGYVSEGDGYMFGRSTLVQFPVNSGGKRLVVRASRTVSRCARLRVVYEW